MKSLEHLSVSASSPSPAPVPSSGESVSESSFVEGGGSGRLRKYDSVSVSRLEETTCVLGEQKLSGGESWGGMGGKMLGLGV